MNSPAPPVFNFLLDCPENEADRYGRFSDLDAMLDAMPDMLQLISSKGDMCWCLQTYLLLKNRPNLTVTCSARFSGGAINIVHSDQLLKLGYRPDAFLVCVRADFPRRRWAQHHLVQNRNQLTVASSYLPLWLQPRLIGRDPARTGVKTVAYVGETTNGNLAGDVEEWRRLFAQDGLDFHRIESGAWNDMSAVDVLVGLRRFPAGSYNGKPPSKLLNAWAAGIPFIGGHDSAYLQVGVPDEDYLRVASMDEALAAARMLRDNPDVYARLKANGSRKAQDFSRENLARRWEEILLGPVLCRHHQWLASAERYERMRSGLLYRIGMLEHHSKQVLKRSVGAARPILRTAR